MLSRRAAEFQAQLAMIERQRLIQVRNDVQKRPDANDTGPSVCAEATRRRAKAKSRRAESRPGSLSVCFHSPLHALESFRQILGIHRRTKRDLGVESQEPRFGRRPVNSEEFCMSKKTQQYGRRRLR